MLPIDQQGRNIESVIPLDYQGDVQRLITNLQNDVESSKNIDTSMQKVLDIIERLSAQHPDDIEGKQNYEDIKAYIRFLHSKKISDARTVVTESRVQSDQLFFYNTSHARIVGTGEATTQGGVQVVIPNRTNQGVDASGRVTSDYGKTIPAVEDFDMESVERGRKILGKIPSKSSDVGSSDSGDQTVDNAESKIKENAGVQEIERALAEINPGTLDQAITVSEKFINLVPDAQTKATLRGVHGAIILNMLRQAGHNLMIRDGKVTIEPKPGVSVVDLETKLQTLVDTGRLSIDTLRTGLLYSSPAFKKYATELGITKDSQGNVTISPQANGKAFLAYVSELQKAGQNSPDITSLLASAIMLESVDFKQAIKGFQDLGQVSAFAEKNPGMLAAVSTTLNTTSSQSSSGTPAKKETNTTFTGSFLGEGATKGKVSSTLSLAGQGLTQGFGDLMKLGKGDPIATLGIGAALFYGVYKMFKQFGFFGGIAGFLGLGALNNWEKIGGNFSGAGKAFDEMLDKASDKIDQIRGKTGSDTPPVQPAESTDAPKVLTEDQVYLRDELIKNQKITAEVERIQKDAQDRNKPWNGSRDDYLTFIENDLKSVPLSRIFPDDKKKSIFSDEFDTGISSIPKNLHPKTLKYIIRMYLGGEEASSSGVDQQQTFLNKYSITTTDIQTKTFAEILPIVAKKRREVAPPPVTAVSPPTPEADHAQWKLGDKVKTNQSIQIYDKDGHRIQKGSHFPSDAQGVYLPKDKPLTIRGTQSVILNGHELIEVSYDTQSIYVSPKHIVKR